MKDAVILKITKEQAAVLKTICDQVFAVNKSKSANSAPTKNFAVSDENLIPRAVGKH